LRFTVVGSADAFNGGGRRHSCYLLEGDGLGPLMIDFGATALMGLRQLGRNASDIKGFAFTHLHGDHVGGYPFLVIDGMFHDVRRELCDIVGPVGTETRLSTVLEAAYGDISTRDRPYDTRIRELFPGGKMDHVGATIHAFAAEHMDPPEVPLCLRVEAPDGTSVAFSGDTAMCDGLMAAAEGADLLVAECSCLVHPCGRHCTWEEWLEVLPKVGAKRVLLTHLGTKVRESVDRLLKEAPAGVDLAFGGVGLVIDL
jgi:ribonuclease BN (tRNA processing enzyme)